jgi:hypothetical protein
MKISICSLCTFITMFATTITFAANLPAGYADVKWGTQFHKIMEAYPKGQVGEYHEEMIYTQDNPEETIATRIFAFKDGKLSSVAVTFSADYVRKTGLENLLQRYIKLYGKGKSSGSTSHMSSYVWEGKQTRITFLYVPSRTDMTVMHFEKK